ncbi:hypothetical protein NHQ30_004296 [Ciborinia camelliae]|nr:hypothetical protein NHQ30_004296 [Ciborinia camelliae]
MYNARAHTSADALSTILRSHTEIKSFRGRAAAIGIASPETKRAVCAGGKEHEALRGDVDADARGDVALVDIDAALRGGGVALVVVEAGGEGGAGGGGGLGRGEGRGEDAGEEGEGEDSLRSG